MNSSEDRLPIYMDCNATTPLDVRVQDIMLHYLAEDFGNAGSRTHVYGTRVKQAVQKARKQVADVVDAEPHEVIFTSGATESNNLAILGLAQHGKTTGKKHIVSTGIEHKAVLDPLEYLHGEGFDISLVEPTSGGWVDPESVASSLRPDTLLVSIMHANNETGVMQPIAEIAGKLSESEAYFHVDAAQGFGKDFPTLREKRVDLISISAHKLYGPKGIGALVMRKRDFERPPVSPLMHGGGQERGLRPGTLPVHLIAALGLTAELAMSEASKRKKKCAATKQKVLSVFESLGGQPNGDQARVLPHVVNISLPGVDSEAVMLSLKNLLAISNGSACTSQKYQPSHVLQAMGLNEETVRGALRISWCHMTENPDWDEVASRIQRLR